MMSSNDLLFGNTRSLNFTSFYEWKEYASKLYKPLLELDPIDKSSRFYSRSSSQIIRNFAIMSATTSGYRSKSLDEDNKYVSMVIPTTGKYGFEYASNKFTLLPGNFLLNIKSDAAIQTRHEEGTTLFLAANKDSLKKILLLDNRISASKRQRERLFNDEYRDKTSAKSGCPDIFLKLAKMIDLLNGDENELSRIGLDDIFQRAMLNIIFPEKHDSEDVSYYKSTRRSDRSVDILCDKIRQFPGHVMTLTEMQETTGLSGRSLQLAFNRRFGCTAREWQRNEHLGRAREMLTDSNNNQSVKQIAYTTGFSSLASFSRFYLARFGELPSVTLKRK